MIVSWNTTNECNLFCGHCYREAGDRRAGELNTEEGKKLIGEIARARFKIMIFSGGEPLIRRDIFELIQYASSAGLRPVLGSNGTLITEEIAGGLKEAGAMGVGISLDSLDADRHDALRRCENAWERAVLGMKNCREAGLPFQIHTTVMNWNAEEIERMTDFAVEMGAAAHHIFFLVPTGRGKNIADESLDGASYESLIKRIMKKSARVPIEVKPTCAPQFMRVAEQLGLETRFSKGCIAGTAYCIVGPTGKVQPCAYLDMEIGDVRETPFDEIWRDSAALQTLRTAAYGGACGHCVFRERCGGCRARAAFYHDGDYMEEDSICRYAVQRS